MGMDVDLASGLRVEQACYAQLLGTRDRAEGVRGEAHAGLHGRMNTIAASRCRTQDGQGKLRLFTYLGLGHSSFSACMVPVRYTRH